MNAHAQCRHCDHTAELEFIEDGLIAAHVCPKKYVSRIFKYSERMDPKEFKDFVQGAVQNMEQVENSNIRIAKRYAWDLTVDRKNNDPIFDGGVLDTKLQENQETTNSIVWLFSSALTKIFSSFSHRMETKNFARIVRKELWSKGLS
jgi:hypothetical protein